LPVNAPSAPEGAEVVEYSGKTIIPGLISAHSHVGIFIDLKAGPENYNRVSILRQLKQLEALWSHNCAFAEQPSWMNEPFFQRALHPAVRTL
jgi:imidazolonepropionase-like amidohydrolase